MIWRVLKYSKLRDWYGFGIDKIKGIDWVEQVSQVVQYLEVLETSERIEELDLEKFFGMIRRISIQIQASKIQGINYYLTNKRLIWK